MEIKSKKEQDVRIMSLKGRMDAVSAPEFDKALGEFIAEREKKFIVDMEEVDYISSAGLRSILAANKSMKTSAGRLCLVNLQNTVKEVFHISGFSSIISIYDSIESALHEYAV